MRLAQLEAEVAAQRARVDELQAQLLDGGRVTPTPPPAARPKRSGQRTLSKTRPSLVAVRDAIEKNGGSAGIDDVIRDLGIKHGAAAVRLQRACEAGLIERASHGVYRVAESHPHGS